MTEGAEGIVIDADPTNRLDFRKKESDGIPSYIQFSRELRKNAQKEITAETSHPPEDIATVEDFFGKANNFVTAQWDKANGPLMQAKYSEWLAKIPQQEMQLRQHFTSPDALEGKLVISHLESLRLESLRKVNPEAWRYLLAAASERQLATVVVTRQWIENLPEQAFQKMGMSKQELVLFTDIAALLGKYVDQAYIKQVELADMPGGSDPTPWTGQGGAVLYDRRVPGSDLGNEDEVEVQTYADTFSYEFPALEKRFLLLADKTDQQVSSDKIPQSYKTLPAYLRKMAATYGVSFAADENLEVTDLNRLWIDLHKDTLELEKSGCPIIVVPQGRASVAKEAGKIDVEVRLGIKTPEAKRLESDFSTTQTIAQGLVDEHKDTLSKPYVVPDVHFIYTPFAFGPDLHEPEKSSLGIHGILVEMGESTADNQISVLQKVLPKVDIDTGIFEKNNLKSNALHELGHAVLNKNDENIRQRLGAGEHVYIIEELKADTVGAKLFLEAAKDKGSDDIDQQFLAILGNVFNYVRIGKNGFSDEYYYSSLIMLNELMSAGVLKATDGNVQIVDSRRGIETLVSLGDEIISLYSDPETTPAVTQSFVKKLISSASSRSPI